MGEACFQLPCFHPVAGTVNTVGSSLGHTGEGDSLGGGITQQDRRRLGVDIGKSWVA